MLLPTAAGLLAVRGMIDAYPDSGEAAMLCMDADSCALIFAKYAIAFTRFLSPTL